ncbi:hypothetical protein [uncultured Megasphaera sp.]|nr:hypothetical protein [uncultured Megasphaera sp.]
MGETGLQGLASAAAAGPCFSFPPSALPSGWRRGCWEAMII